MSLAGKRVVVTRAPHQAGEFVELLEAHGAAILLYPCIEIVPPLDTTQLDAALRDLDTFDWLLLTSGNTVYALQNRLAMLGRHLPARLKVAAVGTSTAREAYEAFGIQPQALPEEHTADALAAILTDGLQPGTRFLLPQSEIARSNLAKKLAEVGGDVTTVTAYRTVTATGGVDLPMLLAQVDAITFTSSSTVEQFLTRIGHFEPPDSICTACIGTVTAETAHKHGFRNIIVPHVFTLDGMVTALEAYFSGKSNEYDKI